MASNIQPYSCFAHYYDKLMEHVDYRFWSQYIDTVYTKYATKCRLTQSDPIFTLELGCGTGSIAIPLSEIGYLVIGLDQSLAMLQIMEKKHNSNKLFPICADMSNFSFQYKFDYIYSIHDSLNYLVDRQDLRTTFALVHGHLNNDGIFMFDLTTEYNILRNFNNKTEYYQLDSMNICWSNSYNWQERLIHSKIEFISGNQHKEAELHTQKIYEMDYIRRELAEIGFSVLAIYGDQTFRPPNNQTIMTNYICKKRA